MSPAPDEIARIEHELDILRSRYAIFQRGAEWARRTLIVAALIVACLILWRVLHNDLLGTAMIVVICTAGLLIIIRSRKDRLIDIVSPIRVRPSSLSEAQEIEEMIALREKRLAELKASPAQGSA
jgi:hypothetical protein